MSTSTVQGSHVSAYCVRCKEKRGMSGQQVGVLENGVSVLRGNCAVCDTKMIKMNGRIL